MPFYEVTPWHVIGGQNGNYELESPWGTPCELILTCISGNGAGIVVIGFDQIGDMSGVIANFATGVATPGFRGLVTRFNTDSPLIFPFDPIPVEARQVFVQIQTDTGGKAAYVTAHFRRLGPPDGAYMGSNAALAATVAMGTSTSDNLKASEQWTANLAADSESVSAQTSRGTNLRRHNAHRKQVRPILTRLQGK